MVLYLQYLHFRILKFPLKNAPPQFSKRKSLANKLFEDMQSCEVRQWQTFLQLRKKYVYILYIYHLAIFGRSNSFPPEKTSTLLSIMKILLEARFESSFCFAETHIFHQFSSYFLFDGQQEIKSRALCTNSIQWITEVGWICQDSVRLRLEPEDSFQLFQDTAHGKTKKRRILLNTIG